MTTRPRPVPFDRSLLPGLAAVALFVLLAAVILGAETSWLVDGGWGFPADASVVASIGAALIGLDAAIPTESFLVALLVIAVALDAALDGSLMLAKRDEERAGGDPVTDGGRTDGDADARRGER